MFLIKTEGASLPGELSVYQQPAVDGLPELWNWRRPSSRE